MVNLKYVTFGLLMLSLPVAANAQGEASEELRKALKSLQGKVVRMTADVRVEKPKEGQGNRMMMIVQNHQASGSKTKQFTGSLDVRLSADGALYAASTAAIPSVRVMRRGEQTLFSQVYAQKAYDLNELMGWLSSTMDSRSLLKEIEKAKRVRVSNEGGEKSYRVTIDGGYFAQRDNDDDLGMPGVQVMAMDMEPAVMEAVLYVTVDDEGQPTRIRCEMQYSDPMKAIMKQAMSGNTTFGPGAKLEEIPGEKVVVTYTVRSNDGPAEAFVEEAAALLESAK